MILLHELNFLDINEFKRLIIDKDIERRTLQYFWQNVETYQQEESVEFVKAFGDSFIKDNLDVEIQSISINLGNWPLCNYNHIVVIIRFGYKNRSIGEYKALFTFAGEVDDDYFVVY